MSPATDKPKATKTNGVFRMDCAVSAKINATPDSGLMLPMIKGSLPDFAPIFETYAAELKVAAEGRPS